MGQSTAYQRARSETADRRHALLSVAQHDANPRLHWIDNYAKSYASGSMFVDKELYKSMLDSSWNEDITLSAGYVFGCYRFWLTACPPQSLRFVSSPIS